MQVVNGKCEQVGCENEAISLVYSRSSKVVLRLCDGCGDLVKEQGAPEYGVDCPNCGCEFGVN